MKKNKILAVSLIGLLLAGALFFAGCEEEEEEPPPPPPGANCFANVKCEIDFDNFDIDNIILCGLSATTESQIKKAMKCKVYKDMLMLDPDDIPTTGISKCDC